MSEIEELRAWWMIEARAEADATLEKAVEYGANSMLDLGRSLARAMHREDISDEECMELSCFFYAQGKMGRWLDAIVRGDRPGDDTPFDIRVYMGMVRRIRATGSWPGDGGTLVDWDSIVFGGKRLVEEVETLKAQRRQLVSALGVLKHQMGAYPKREHHERWMRDIDTALEGVVTPGATVTPEKAIGVAMAAAKRHDPTHGQIDFDIQDAVDEMEPNSLGQRVALQQTLQTKRDRGEMVLGIQKDPPRRDGQNAETVAVEPPLPLDESPAGDPPQPVNERTTFMGADNRVVTVDIINGDEMRCADSRCPKIHDPSKEFCDVVDLGDPSTDPKPGVPA